MIKYKLIKVLDGKVVPVGYGYGEELFLTVKDAIADLRKAMAHSLAIEPNELEIAIESTESNVMYVYIAKNQYVTIAPVVVPEQ